MKKQFVGIDIGGTKISVCIGDVAGKIKASQRISTKDVPKWEKGVQKITQMVESLRRELYLQEEEIAAVGISAPGPLSVEQGRLLDLPNLPGWRSAPIVQELKKQLPYPMILNNDANAQALAEYAFGSFQKVNTLVYLTCSTGMGGGIIHKGRIVQGKSDTAGEIGHFVLDIDGPLCPCSQRGCFEMYCGGANFRKHVQALLKDSACHSAALDAVGGDLAKLDLIHLEKALYQGDPFAEKMWDGFTTRLAQGIGVILMTLNPEVVILGTIASHMQEWMLPRLREKLPRFSWKIARDCCTITTTSLGEKISELSGLALASQAQLELGR